MILGHAAHSLPLSGKTDFTYFKIIGWGWVYLSTILDDFSRYISGERDDYIKDNDMSHVRGAPYHPQPKVKSRDGIRR